MVCAGCGATVPLDEPFPFRCPNAGRDDDTDHVLVRRLDTTHLRFPHEDQANPFLRYRALFRSHRVATAHGWSDEEYVDLVEALDKDVAGVQGHGFAVTPFARSRALSDELGFGPAGGVWVKDETGNVSGSHKARHLMGLVIHLEVVERLGLAPTGSHVLAIASCGNAALAGAVLARACGRPLKVFAPPSADPVVVGRLRDLGALVEVSPRQNGVSGDPSVWALHQALRGGALPFTCQGNENGLAIEGGETLAYEIASDLRQEGTSLDRVFVQVGGGALGSAIAQGLREAREMGAIPALPRLHMVQTEGAHPLQRAHDRVVERIATGGGSAATAVAEALRYAATHRSEFMWSWEQEPASVAGGILDDETYDWLALVRGMTETGGGPVVVDETTLEQANMMGRGATGIDVDHTGTAGLAGLLNLRLMGAVADEERVAVLFTGIRRRGEGRGR